MLVVAKGNTTMNERLSAELAEVEGRFCAELLSDLACVNELVSHVESYRGKMLRPTLVLASGMACGGLERELTDEHRVVAAVAEMVHMATLVHDDILDEARMRRRGATINKLSGNETAVMLGDYLISHAYHLCSSLGRSPISQMIASATNTVCEGELLQLANRNNWALDEAVYFDIIRRKTASLCGVCCRLGAMLSGTTEETADSLYDYGEKLGTAFQIVDDLLDLTGDPITVGKTLGRDLQKGKATLPLIHHLRSAGPAGKQELMAIVKDLEPTDEDLGLEPAQTARLAEMLGTTDSVGYASRWATRLIQAAKGSVGSLPESAGKAFLMDMADAILIRKY